MDRLAESYQEERLSRDASAWINPSGDHEAMSHLAAQIIALEVRQRPELLLCAATGETPTLTYQLLGGFRREEPRLFERMHVVKLDEWGGLEMDDPATCESYLQRHVIVPLGIDPERYISLDSNSPDPQGECERVAECVKARSGIDLCILGLGTNGHLGLNEPAKALEPFAHVTDPAESSLKHSMLERASGSPSYGLTLGMAEILGSRKILLLVSGLHKRKQLEQLRTPKISTLFPASFLWLHPNARCLFAD